MEPLFRFLEGKKSYTVALITLILAGVEMIWSVKIPDQGIYTGCRS